MALLVAESVLFICCTHIAYNEHFLPIYHFIIYHVTCVYWYVIHSRYVAHLSIHNITELHTTRLPITITRKTEGKILTLPEERCFFSEERTWSLNQTSYSRLVWYVGMYVFMCNMHVRRTRCKNCYCHISFPQSETNRNMSDRPNLSIRLQKLQSALILHFYRRWLLATYINPLQTYKLV